MLHLVVLCDEIGIGGRPAGIGTGKKLALQRYIVF